MGLTVHSTGRRSMDDEQALCRGSGEERIVAIAGNPNVGKSTVFNALTGMKQHTGNWPGKTVSSAKGAFETDAHRYVLVDIPGTYSLMAHSAEEEVARDFICFGEADAVIIVCDATCLERNLNLVFQILEIHRKVLVCVNLADEAKKKGIHVDAETLSDLLRVPVILTAARKKRTLRGLADALDAVVDGHDQNPRQPEYSEEIERAISRIQPLLEKSVQGRIPARWLSLKLLEGDTSLLAEVKKRLGVNLLADRLLMDEAEAVRAQCGMNTDEWKDAVVSGIVGESERIAGKAVSASGSGYSDRDRRVDRILTGRRTAYPVMLIMLAGIFWLTIAGANLPSQMLSAGLFQVQELLTEFFRCMNAPEWLHSALVLGMYRVLAWVVAVMLPPMAIFFPLFTLLEDSGYLPRIAYNLDCPFKKCCACGKQALTMCMGFGCNAAGVVGCRIIDSPRERLIAILTNSLVPCNGRFPTLIALITMFFALSAGGFANTVWSALLLTAVILVGVGMTFVVSRLLSKTILKGVPSSFTLELPPYRRPQIGSVLVRSVFDRTLFVLGRAIAVAAPAGLIIWLMANVKVGNASLLVHSSELLDPFGRIIGLDGVMIMAFILGFPANEIVMPIAIMAYMAQETLPDLGSTTEMREVLVNNSWTWITALCTMIFSLFHWPCSTTLLTIRKETGSWKWTAVSAVLPTAIGMLLCFVIASITRIF